MSDYTRTVQMLAEGEYGPSANLRFSYQDSPRRCLAWLTRATDDGGEEVVALAAGPDHGAACRGLLRQLAGERSVTLTTEEVAGVLGVNESQVRQLRRAGRLVASSIGAGRGDSHAYTPAVVHRYLALPRRQGQWRGLAQTQAERGERGAF